MDIGELFSIYEREKKRKNRLMPLPENFYKKLSDLIKKYQKLLELGEPDSEEHRKLQLELENLKELAKQIANLRLEKILKLALFEAKENIKIVERKDMPVEERFIFDVLSTLLKNFYKYILENVTRGESPKIEEIVEKLEPYIKKKAKKIDKVLVIFTKEFSQIVGPDGKLYGPFEKEEIYSLPKEIASRLMELEICEEIRPSRD